MSQTQQSYLYKRTLQEETDKELCLPIMDKTLNSLLVFSDLKTVIEFLVEN